MSTQVITSESIIASPREGDPATLLARLIYSRHQASFSYSCSGGFIDIL